MHITSVTEKQLLTTVSSVLITTEHCSQGQTGPPGCLELASVVTFPKGEKQLIIPTENVTEYKFHSRKAILVKIL